MKDVSEYPNLFAELLSRGWAEADLEKVAGLNLLRVFRGAEAVGTLIYFFFYNLDCISYVIKIMSITTGARSYGR